MLRDQYALGSVLKKSGTRSRDVLCYLFGCLIFANGFVFHDVIRNSYQIFVRAHWKIILIVSSNKIKKNKEQVNYKNNKTLPHNVLWLFHVMPSFGSFTVAARWVFYVICSSWVLRPRLAPAVCALLRRESIQCISHF